MSSWRGASVVLAAFAGVVLSGCPQQKGGEPGSKYDGPISAPIVPGPGSLDELPGDGAKPDADAKRDEDKEPGARSNQGASVVAEGPDIPVSKRGNKAFKSFRTAKNHLYDIHKDGKHERTFYCDCTYANRAPKHTSCGYKIRRDKTRASRTEAEHVVPASLFGRRFRAWLNGHKDCVKSGRPYKGRRCLEEVSDEFAYMQADLYNLQPTIGEVNGDRMHYEMAIISGEAREYGKCDVEIDDQRVEPAERVRGDVARTYLYMAWAYPKKVKLEDKERAMFLAWSKSDPVDAWELERAKMIEEVQGNTNPFVVKSK